MDDYSADAVVLRQILNDNVTPERRVVDSLEKIEEAMDWYDHVATAFLLIENPKEAREKIQLLLESYKCGTKDWHKLVLTPLFASETKIWVKLIEALLVLKQKKMLNFLELDMHINCKTENLNQFRLKLFRIIDNLCQDKAEELVAQVNAKLKEPNFNSSWSVEMHFLKWIETGEITEQDYTKLCPEIGSGEKSLLSLDPIPAVLNDYEKSSSSTSSRKPSNTISPFKYHIKNGLCVIINQMFFRIDQTMEPRLLKVSLLLHKYL